MSRRALVVCLALAILACAVVLLGCTKGGASHATAEDSQATTKPLFGNAGFDDAGADKSEKPGNDFFRYANGGWIDAHPIPADLAGFSKRRLMSDRTEQQLHEIMEHEAASAGHAPTTIPGKVGAFYKSFMDSTHIAELGAKPLAATLEEIRAAKTREAIGGLMGRTNSDYEGSLFGSGIDVDLKNVTRYAVYLFQGGLGLPDRDYYIEKSFAAQKTAYRNYVATLLKLLDWPNPEPAADRIVAYETAIAQASWTRTQQRDPVATYNPVKASKLGTLAPGFPWHEFLTSMNVAQLDTVIVAEKSAFPKLAAEFARTPIETLQAWLAFTVADNAAPYLSPPFVDAYFEMRSKTLAGAKIQRTRWKRAVFFTAGGDYGAGGRVDRWGNLGWSVGELYSARYFPPASKQAIEDLVANLKAAYHTRLVALDWMGPETKKKAIEKLETYTIKVGYPDKNRDYSKVEVLDDDLVGNARRAAYADWNFYVGRIGGPVDRGDWGMTPQTNDAYNGSLRDIVFPAGILQPPIFDADADAAINYGAAGGVIGHELTHGFDDQGRKIDASGALRDWWTKKDADTFQARAKILGAQYSKYEPIRGVHVNGELTMGENIADLAGLTLALDAYRASLKGQPAPVLDGYTGDQRVLLGWAQAWRGKVTDDYVKKQVVSDPHSPRQFRVIGPTRNTDVWYDAFKVQPTDKMFVAPKQCVRIC